MSRPPDRRVWSLPLRVELPLAGRLERLPSQITVPVDPLRRRAKTIAFVIPVLLMVVGITVALVSARRAERPATEAVGSLGVEAGAALWFAGAVSLGIRNSPTLQRVAVLAATAIAGMALIALALVRGWSGAGLTLAMEFGVGAVAVAVIDVVLLGLIHRHLEHFAHGPDGTVVTIGVGTSWRLVDVRVGTAHPDQPDVTKC